MPSQDEDSRELRKSFGERVKALRQDRSLSQEILAQKAGLYRTYVADVERGARNLSLQAISQLADALGVSIPDLFSNVGVCYPAIPGTSLITKLKAGSPKMQII